MLGAPRAASAWLSERFASGLPVGTEARAARVGCLTHAVDFERVLRVRSRAQGPHFALHHLSGVPAPRRRPVRDELSTDAHQNEAAPVDDCPVARVAPVEAITSSRTEAALVATPSRPPACGWWLGAVVPKRHAKRAVTRNLVKRQIRALVRARAATLTPGLWVVRLRAGFDKSRFPSAASAPLRRAVREELEALLQRCSTRPRAVPAAQPRESAS